jgi:hypothetical protein
MQDCFRLHPEIYGDELDDDEQDAPGDGGAEDRGPATSEVPKTANDGKLEATPANEEESAPTSTGQRQDSVAESK